MAIRALPVRRPGVPFPGKLSVATLAVFMVSNIELANLAVSFLWIVTGGTLLDRLSLFPDVFSVLIFVVTFIAGHIIIFNVVQMGKGYGHFFMQFLAFIYYCLVIWFTSRDTFREFWVSFWSLPLCAT